MGLKYAKLILSNPVLPELSSIESKASVDSGVLHLCIPKHLALQLKIKTLEDREVTFADGSKQLIPYAGPIKVNVLRETLCVDASHQLNVIVPAEPKWEKNSQ
jgi:hypothetical protein